MTTKPVSDRKKAKPVGFIVMWSGYGSTRMSDGVVTHLGVLDAHLYNGYSRGVTMFATRRLAFNALRRTRTARNKLRPDFASEKWWILPVWKGVPAQ